MTRLLRSIAFVFAASLFAVTASAQTASNGAPDADQTFFDFQVDQPVKVRVVHSPVYPERLRAMNVDGQVLVQFVVDESGEAQMSTFKVIKTTNPDFTDAVRRAISNTTYSPAEVRGRRVKQLVQQPFAFNAH
jgi:periplasmic protein TonB